MTSLVEITRDNFHRFQNRILEIERISFPTPWTAGSFREEMEKAVSHIRAVTVGDSLAGYLCFWMFADEIHLMNIAVHPENRRNGIGRQLLESMIRTGLSHEVQVVWLEVRPSNSPARLMYHRAGFRNIGQRPKYYRDTGEDAIVMCLRLFDNNDK